MAIRHFENRPKHWALIVNDRPDRLYATLSTGTLAQMRDDLAATVRLAANYPGLDTGTSTVYSITPDAAAVMRDGHVEFYRIIEEG